MSEPRLDPSEALREGVRCCRRGAWRRGLQLLTPLAGIEELNGKLPGLYYSYLGHAISRCEGRRHDGVELCRHAVEQQFYQPENHYNLACTYLYANNRRRAFKALQTGLQIDPQNPMLLRLSKQLGVRRPPVLPFLDRANLVNRWLGRARAQMTRAKAERQKRRDQTDEWAEI